MGISWKHALLYLLEHHSITNCCVAHRGMQSRVAWQSRASFHERLERRLDQAERTAFTTLRRCDCLDFVRPSFVVRQKSFLEPLFPLRNSLVGWFFFAKMVRPPPRSRGRERSAVYGCDLSVPRFFAWIIDATNWGRRSEFGTTAQSN